MCRGNSGNRGSRGNRGNRSNRGNRGNRAQVLGIKRFSQGWLPPDVGY